MVLNRHCGSLSQLEISEWLALKEVIDKIDIYCDDEYDHHYKNKKEVLLTKADKVSLFEKMKGYLNANEM